MLSHETCCAATDPSFEFVADVKPLWGPNYSLKFCCKPVSKDMVQPRVLYLQGSLSPYKRHLNRGEAVSGPTEPTGMGITLVWSLRGFFWASCSTSPLFLVVKQGEQAHYPSVKHCIQSVTSKLRAKESNFTGLPVYFKLWNKYFANLRLK